MDHIKPVKDKVLIRINRARPISKGGIIDPTLGKRKTPIGKVLSIGETVNRKDILDNHVYFDIYEGWRVDEDHILIEEKHIYFIAEQEDNDGNS